MWILCLIKNWSHNSLQVRHWKPQETKIKSAELLCILNNHIIFTHYWGHSWPAAGILQSSRQVTHVFSSTKILYCISKWLNLPIWSDWMHEEGQPRKKTEKSLSVFLLDISRYLRYTLIWFFANCIVISSKNFEMSFLDFGINQWAVDILKS